MRKINIAIDGPSGVGKSTISKILADEIDYLFINTGLMYRTISYFCLKNNIDVKSEINVVKSLPDINLTLLPKEQVLLNNENVTKFLRDDDVSISASLIATYRDVREFCVLKQKKYTQKKGVVMEGRDIGSVVIPDAELKIFLTANSEVRIKRRIEQLKRNKVIYDTDCVSMNLKKRDEADSTRIIDPLIKMPDAIEIDTSNISIKKVNEIILKLVQERIHNE
ncbi:MAG: (d)CMP kinase [Metamycoplasmataceae bacterium]